jgi:hypothetical protein
VRGTGLGGAFQDLIIVRIRKNGLELTRNGNYAQKCEQIRYGLDSLLSGEGQLRLELCRQLVEDFAACYTLHLAGTG